MSKNRRGLPRPHAAQGYSPGVFTEAARMGVEWDTLSVVRCSSGLSLQCQGLTHRRPAVQTRYTPEQGMGMLGLEQVQLFWERSLDTKVLIGWSADTIVISVRGTASLRNAIADIQVRADCASPHQGSAALQQAGILLLPLSSPDAPTMPCTPDAHIYVSANRCLLHKHDCMCDGSGLPRRAR